MSKKVHPYSHRLGIIRDWKSRWFGTKHTFKHFLQVDIAIREHLTKKLRGFFVSVIDIERGEKALRVIIKTSRPGMIIGRNGEGIIKLRGEVEKIVRRLSPESKQELKLDVEEVRSPESSAAIVGQMIAEGLEKRLPYRRVMKQMIEKVMANRNVQGVRIGLYGRLAGADIAREEELKRGRIPLQTLRADVDFNREKAHMTYGDIGIKVWIYRGEIFKK